MAFKLHGVKLPERKATEGMSSVKMPAPETVTIPTAMHIGAPVKPVVKVGDEVFVGTLIAEDNEKLSAPVYSSVSGKVTKLTESHEVQCWLQHPLAQKVETPKFEGGAI